MSLVSLVGCATGDTSARVVVRFDGTDTVRVAYDTDPALASPAFTTTFQATASRAFDLSGLSAGTDYYYAAEVGGVLDTVTTGHLRTHPAAGSQASFTVAISSCAAGVMNPGAAPLLGTDSRTSNSPIFDTIRQSDPLMFVHQGDLHYYDLGSGDHGVVGGGSLDNYRLAYDDVLNQPRQHELYRQVSWLSQWDDHDYGPNNSDGTLGTKDNAAQAYRERVPHLPLANASGPVYTSFEVGRVLFVLLDTRFERSPNASTDDASKTMLGSAQKSWLRGVLETSTAKALILLSPTPWMGTTNDTWENFTTERDELTLMFRELGWEDRMVCVNGDYHGLAMDSGTGNEAYSGARFPVYVFGSLDSYDEANAGTGTAQYDLGQTEPGSDQWGTVAVNDLGDYVELTATGMDGAAAWRTHSFFVATVADPPPAPAVLSSLSHLTDLQRIQAVVEDQTPQNPFTESFPASIAEGWGTAESGQVWTSFGGDTTDYHVTDVGGGVRRGRIDFQTVGPDFHSVHAGTYDDVEFTATVTIYVSPEGGVISAGLAARFDPATGNHYWFRAQHEIGNTLDLNILKGSAAGGFVTIDAATFNGGTFDPFTPVHIRCKAEGATLLARLWNDGEDEPDTWQVSASDTDYLSGGIGVTANVAAAVTSPLPISVDFDDFQTPTPPPFAVNLERMAPGENFVPVRGGTGVILPRGGSVTIDDYEWPAGVPLTYRATTFAETGELGFDEASITANLSQAWLKSIRFPNLNMAIRAASATPVVARARNGVYPIMGSARAVAVTDVRGAGGYELVLSTVTQPERVELAALLNTGEPVFLHVPASFPVPGGHYVVGDVPEDRKDMPWDRRWWTLPLTPVTAPAPDVVGTTITWQGVVDRYETWDATVADQESWNSLNQVIA